MILDSHGIHSSFENSAYEFNTDRSRISLEIPNDLIISSWNKLPGIILSKLNLNKKIFARNCEVRSVDRKTTSDFLNLYHLMNDANAASRLGLYYKEELLALATFSKGRKMDRLPIDKRSYELIRFCSKEGITVTGGLSRLLKHFCREKNAGDIMTYIDRQLSNGEAYLNSGFKLHSESGTLSYKISKKDHKRSLQTTEITDDDHYLEKGPGNLKLIYTCHE